MNDFQLRLPIIPIKFIDYIDASEFSYPIHVVNIINDGTNKQLPSDHDMYVKLIDEERLMPFDLDIPGAELDDADECIGKEDEENNFYSIGGDNHNNLEEHE